MWSCALGARAVAVVRERAETPRERAPEPRRRVGRVGLDARGCGRLARADGLCALAAGEERLSLRLFDVLAHLRLFCSHVSEHVSTCHGGDGQGWLSRCLFLLQKPERFSLKYYSICRNLDSRVFLFYCKKSCLWIQQAYQLIIPSYLKRI